MAYLGTKPSVATSLQDGIVTSDKISDGAVGTNDLANGAVTSAKIASGAAVANIGYTPFNKAGDSVSGAIVRTGTISNNLIPMTDKGIFITGGTVTNNNTFQTVFGLRDFNESSTGVAYRLTEQEVGGFISIRGEFGNAALHALVAFSGKHYFGFTHFSILSSYAYNSAIQISGRDIQIRQAGIENKPVQIRIITLPCLE